jgi:hypothetical protein
VVGVGDNVFVTGVAGTSAVGTVAVSGNILVTVDGVSATDSISSINVWAIVDASQTADWSTSSTTQNPGWLQIAA